MKNTSRLLGLLLLALPLTAHSAPGAFHPAQSDAEKAIDAIMMGEITGNGQSTYLMRAEAHADDAKYTPLFTPAYKKSVLDVNAALCKGKKGNAASSCMLEISPISCDTEGAESYVYQTQKEDDKTAIITYAWPDSTDANATFRMIKENGAWKLDGVTCAGKNGKKFNM